MPFEAEINDHLVQGTNRLTVKISNLLDYTTLPVGNYSETKDENGRIIRKVDENFDFFNYAGIHRPVKIYSTPHDYIEDIVIAPEVDLVNNKADVNVTVKTGGSFDEVRVTIIDEEGNEVVQASGENVNVNIVIFVYGNRLMQIFIQQKLKVLKLVKQLMCTKKNLVFVK